MCLKYGGQLGGVWGGLFGLGGWVRVWIGFLFLSLRMGGLGMEGGLVVLLFFIFLWERPRRGGGWVSGFMS
jgi:hypothetical protein